MALSVRNRQDLLRGLPFAALGIGAVFAGSAAALAPLRSWAAAISR